MSLKQYRAFTATVESGSVTKAGEILNCTQSAVTHLLSDFENETGLTLLKRNKKGVFLTESGKRLYPLVKEAVEADFRVKETIKKIRGENSNVIRIATFTSVAVNWLPAIMNEFKMLHPSVVFEMVDGGYFDMENALKTSSVDIGFVAMPLELNCLCEPLYKDRLLAVLPKNKYSEYSSFPIEKFETESVICLAEDTDQDYRRTFNNAGIKPNIKYRTREDYAMISMVENNLGICLVPELLLKGRKNDVTIMEINPPAFRTIGLAMPFDQSAGELVKEMFKFIKSWVNINYPSNSINI